MIIHLATLHIPRRHMRKRKFWTIIGRPVLCSFGLSIKDEELDLPSLYMLPQLHKCSYSQRYIAGSAKCSIKPLSKLITYSINGQHELLSYWDTSYSRDGVNQIWILKNSKDQLVYIKARSLSTSNSTNTFDISTLYTTIPPTKLKDKD